MEIARNEEFSENTLFCGDAGFVGYPLWPKGGRYRPANPDKKPLGDPKLRPLTEREEQKLQEIAE